MHRAHRRLLIPAAVAASIALAFTGCGDAATESGPIKIGAVLDITGVGANLGVPEQNTLNMLAEQLNEDGGINGREVELIIEDNQSTEDGAARATTQLIENNKAGLIIGALALYSLIQRRNVVDEAWNQISVQLKRRHDLIPNLVNAVKGYMDFEQETLTREVEGAYTGRLAGDL